MKKNIRKIRFKLLVVPATMFLLFVLISTNLFAEKLTLAYSKSYWKSINMTDSNGSLIDPYFFFQSDDLLHFAAYKKYAVIDVFNGDFKNYTSFNTNGLIDSLSGGHYAYYRKNGNEYCIITKRLGTVTINPNIFHISNPSGNVKFSRLIVPQDWNDIPELYVNNKPQRIHSVEYCSVSYSISPVLLTDSFLIILDKDYKKTDAYELPDGYAQATLLLKL